MKKIMSLVVLFVVLSFNNASSQINWPSGAMQTITAFTNTTKTTTMTPLTCSNTAVYASITVDTSLVLRATINSNIKKGALLYVTVINGATAATRVITGSTGITMVSYTMTSAKSHVLSFFYDGTNYINTGVIKIN
jgi:hypothetical protein